MLAGDSPATETVQRRTSPLSNLRNRVAEAHHFRLTTDGFHFHERGLEDVSRGDGRLRAIDNVSKLPRPRKCIMKLAQVARQRSGSRSDLSSAAINEQFDTRNETGVIRS